MEREKGFEPGISRAVSETYATPEDAPESPMQSPDASSRVSTELVGGDTRDAGSALPVPTPEMFLHAGFIVADRAARANAGKPVLDVIVHRAVQLAVALRDRPA
jgi:hypothetical protein